MYSKSLLNHSRVQGISRQPKEIKKTLYTCAIEYPFSICIGGTALESSGEWTWWSKVSDAYILVFDGKICNTNTECSSGQSHKASVPDYISTWTIHEWSDHFIIDSLYYE